MWNSIESVEYSLGPTDTCCATLFIAIILGAASTQPGHVVDACQLIRSSHCFMRRWHEHIQIHLDILIELKELRG